MATPRLQVVVKASTIEPTPIKIQPETKEKSKKSTNSTRRRSGPCSIYRRCWLGFLNQKQTQFRISDTSNKVVRVVLWAVSWMETGCIAIGSLSWLSETAVPTDLQMGPCFAEADMEPRKHIQVQRKATFPLWVSAQARSLLFDAVYLTD